MDSLLRYIVGSQPQTFWLAAAFALALCRLIVTYLGIKAGIAARPIARVDFILAQLLLGVLGFIAFGSLLMMLTAFGRSESDAMLLSVMMILNTVLQYFFVKIAVQRLRSIGWSPRWAWLMTFDSLSRAMTLILCCVPPGTGRVRREDAAATV